MNMRGFFYERKPRFFCNDKKLKAYQRDPIKCVLLLIGSLDFVAGTKKQKKLNSKKNSALSARN